MAGNARPPNQLPENASDSSSLGREMLARVQVQRRRDERQGWRGRVRWGPAAADDGGGERTWGRGLS
jgi:hypothetical protein